MTVEFSSTSPKALTMKWKEWLSQYQLSNIALDPVLLELDITFNDQDKKAAWDLRTEIITRSVSSPNEEFLGSKPALDSIYSLFGVIRDIIKNNGLEAINFSVITTAFLEQLLRPFTNKWHKISIEGGFDDPNKDKEFRSEIELLKNDLLKFYKMLSHIAGVDESKINNLKVNDSQSEKSNIRINPNKTLKTNNKFDTPPAIGVDDIASVIAELVPSLTKDGGMMVGIFGSWGRGKTYLFNRLLEKVNSKNNSYIPVVFSAWKYNTADASWVYLYKTLYDKYLESENNQKSFLQSFKIEKSDFIKRKIKESKIYKIFFLNANKYGYFSIWMIFLSLMLFTWFSIFSNKIGILTQIQSTIGIILFVKLIFLYIKYRDSIAFVYQKYFTSGNSVDNSLLGIQDEIQQEIKILLRVWLKDRNEKIVLFIDDLDRCDIDQIVPVLDGLRLTLDEEEIFNKLLIVVAVDDQAIKESFDMKYKGVYDGKKSTLKFTEYMEKIFIFGLKLMPLDTKESSVIFDSFIKHHFPSSEYGKNDISEQSLPIKNLGEKATHIEGTNLTSKPTEPTEPTEHIDFLSQFEINQLKNGVTRIRNSTPRKIRIFIYKYVIFIRLYAALRNSKITEHTSSLIIEELLDEDIANSNSDSDEKEILDKISGMLSAF